MQQEHQETSYIKIAIVLASGVFLVAGLVVVSAMVEEADARCEGTKKNKDICKDKKPKNHP